ncbi:porin family protein [Amphritea japonica]|uniref:Surface lipoprotein assembly modifier C-terminal domain-containing protein n=1 Tax=Amphritea japonica ATCC BAA-1530 TaxID=1278309 RepID=A0A7R6PI89_9GAMM|nr:porin family protein [Amphritea japonica]BBB24935.1 conserved hypothetical protein [Amphritea japonica ATCC BAA-1530]
MLNDKLTFKQLICLVFSTSASLFSYADADNKTGSNDRPAEIEVVHIERKLQSLFTMGGIALQQRNFPLAVAIFREFLKKESSPRVQLELARALFLMGEFSQAKQEFNAVLLSGGLPWPVKQKIYLYLREIDKALGFVDFSLALVSDNNPTNFTSKEEVTILGHKLTVAPPPEKRVSQGLNYKLMAGAPLTDNFLTQAYVALSVRDFEQNTLDSYTLDTGIRYIPENHRNIQYTLGMENSWDTESLKYDYSYAGIKYSPRITDQFNQIIEYSIGQLDIENADHLDALQHSVAANIIVPIGRNSRALGGLTVTDSRARENPYSYISTTFSAAVEVPINSWSIDFGGKLAWADYKGSDPFFGITRQDNKSTWHINLFNRETDWQGLTPIIGISYEQVESSIDYYTYDKIVFTVELRSFK